MRPDRALRDLFKTTKIGKFFGLFGGQILGGKLFLGPPKVQFFGRCQFSVKVCWHNPCPNLTAPIQAFEICQNRY